VVPLECGCERGGGGGVWVGGVLEGLKNIGGGVGGVGF